MDKISVNGASLVDEYGRERIFNGVNLVFKGDHEKSGTEAFIPGDWDEPLMQKLRERGMNLVRLGLIWEAVEPQPGIYAEDYLDYLSGVMDICAKNGIYCFLDMHQDLFSSFGVGYGDGAPPWACLTGGAKLHKQKFVWAEGYFFPGACHKAFDSFWSNARYNGRGLQDYFIDMWVHVAERFKDKPNLLGFDFFNEPFPGSSGWKITKTIAKAAAKTILTHKNVDRKKLVSDLLHDETRADVLDVLDDPEVCRSIFHAAYPIVREFDVKRYYPFLRKAAAAIRRVTDKGIIFMDNSYFSNLGIPYSVPKLVYPDGTPEKNVLFAPHGYDIMVDTPLTNNASNELVDFIFDEHKKTQERLGIPVVVGEWGGFFEEPGSEYTHLRHLLKKFDSNKWSCAYWCYWHGLEDSTIMQILSRPYPQAVPGVIDAYEYDREADVFTLSFTAPDKKSKKPAVVYLHKKPASVEADGKFQMSEFESGACLLSVTPVPGANTVKVVF